MAQQPKSPKVFTFRVSLDGSNPRIWRRFEVTDDLSLDLLHSVIQIVMGWEFAHLYEFVVGAKRYDMPMPIDMGGPLGDAPADEVRIGEVLSQKGDKLTYVYDMGDSWMHTLALGKISEPEPGRRYPRCLSGKGACPPEDCGGIWGYYDMLEVIRDPDHEDHENTLEWLGDEFDPDDFDLAAIETALEDFDKYCRGCDEDDGLEEEEA